MRILGLDWGEVRVGGAISDPLGKIAFPLDKFIRAKQAIDEIKKVVQELAVEKIVIGIPKNLAGNEGKSAIKVADFVEKLKKVIPTEIEMLDERFTSVEAEKKLSSMGMKEGEQRTIKDNIAAQIILQQYLDNKNN